MTREQLRELAKENNKQGSATPVARYAQELIWEERYPEKIRLVDDYEGWINEEDEKVQDLLDEIYVRAYFRQRGKRVWNILIITQQGKWNRF